jgi:hypothetical protein
MGRTIEVQSNISRALWENRRHGSERAARSRHSSRRSAKGRRWRPGDITMWDNRCILHRGRPWPDDKPRHVVRTTISATDADGLADMRPHTRAA